jgi:hypothetical protein
MIEISWLVGGVVFALCAGAAVMCWALCECSARADREAERQQWLAWCARRDDPERRDDEVA